MRLGISALLIALRWGAGAVADLLRSRERRTRAVARRQAWSARRLVADLGALKGAFAKAGQFASLRYDVLPSEVREPLESLQQRVPAIPFDQIRAIVEAELGGRLADHFEEFAEAPLGAASIAQVHRARLLDGRVAAVKVQYPWVSASLPADLRVLHAAISLWSRLRGGSRADLDRFFGEFAEGLHDELDFLTEASVATQIQANLAGDPQVVVPTVYPELCTSRVLTMEYHPTIEIIDRPALEARGVEPARLLEVIARAYMKQVFVDGLFHADPHPGNLFLVDEPGCADKPRVLFVDFGLCKQLRPELRRGMRKGIYALLKRDLDGFVAEMVGLGMVAEGAEAGVRNAVESMFEHIGAEAGSAGMLSASGSQVLGLKDEAKALLEQTPGLQLPNDLLLYAKTLSYLFGLGAQMAPETDLMKLSLPYLLRFLAAGD